MKRLWIQGHNLYSIYQVLPKKEALKSLNLSKNQAVLKPLWIQGHNLNSIYPSGFTTERKSESPNLFKKNQNKTKQKQKTNKTNNLLKAIQQMSYLTQLWCHIEY